jgi:hypothetical protein
MCRKLDGGMVMKTEKWGLVSGRDDPVRRQKGTLLHLQSLAYNCSHLDEAEEKVERYKSDHFLENRRM